MPIRSLLWVLALFSSTLSAYAVETGSCPLGQEHVSARFNALCTSTRAHSAKPSAATPAAANSTPSAGHRSLPKSADGTLARAQAAAEHAHEGPRRPQRSEDAGSAKRRYRSGGAAQATPHGPRPIAEIRKGDLVLARDPDSGALAYKPVTQVFITPGKPLVELRVQSAAGSVDVIHATPEHPFWIEGRGWTNAGELELGSGVTTSLGQSAELIAAQTLPERRTVYNLEVADFHTYFVGQGEAWVHNTCGCSTAATGGGGRATGGGGGGRHGNFFKPDPDAQGPHTVFRRNPDTGRVENYQTFDPQGLAGGNKRFRGTGKPHGGVEPPLVVEPKPGHPGGRPVHARPASPDETPLGF